MTAAKAPTAGQRFARLLFLTIGIAATAFGAWQGWRSLRLLEHGVAVTGVIASDQAGTAADLPVAHPLIAFRTASGQVIRYRHAGWGYWRIGAPVALLYDPAVPAATATVRSFWGLWGLALWPLPMGLGFIALVACGAEIRLRAGRH